MYLLQIGMAQDAKIKINWEEEEKAFFLGNLHRVTCEFTTNTDRMVKLIIKPEAPLKLLSPSSFKIDAKKEEVNASSVKIYLPQTGESSKDSLSFEIIVQSIEDESLLGKEKLCLEIKERIVIRLEPIRTQIPIDASDSLALIPIRVKNMGKRKYEVGLTLKNKPLGLKVLDAEKIFMLEPKRDTLIDFRVKPDKTWQKVYSAYLQYILTLQKNGEEVTDCKISAFPMGHIKKYHSPSFTINNTHEFGLGGQFKGENQNVIDFSSKGSTPFLKGLINYQLQSFFYSDLGEVNLSSSVIKYLTRKNSFTAGHVSYNDETSLSGRGFIYEAEKDSQYFHAGYINGAYELFAPTLAFDTQTGNSFIGGFNKTVPGFGLIESNGVIKFTKPSNTGLFWFTNTIKNDRNYFYFRLGLSVEQDKASLTKRNIHSGIALNADYEKEAKNWTFQTSNRFSTMKYSGSIPGNFMTNNNFQFHGWEPVIIKASTRVQKSKETVMKNDQLLNRSNEVINYQVHFETTQTGNWRIMATPSQVFTKNNFADLSQPEAFYQSTTSEVKLAINRRKKGFSMLWNSEIGTFKFGEQGDTQKKFLFYRFGFNLSNKNLGLNTAYTKGSKRLSDALRYEQFDTYFSSFLATARWGKWFFDRKVKFNFSNQLSYNNIREQWTNSCALKTKAILPKNLTLNAELVIFKTNDYNDLFWSMKLVKKIGNYRPPSGAKKLKITLFEDVNNNGTWEKSERTLPGIFVQVDGIPFVTKGGGWILYKSVPIGEYPISIIDPSGELAGGQQTIKVENSMEVHVPLYKTIPLTGMVKEIKVRFKSSKFELLGIPVIAKNVQEEVFTTYTQPDGSFAFNLPANEYTVYIDPAAFGKKFEFPDNFQKVDLGQSEQAELSLSVKVKSRNMTIQKF